jgi:TPR repeat protein
MSSLSMVFFAQSLDEKKLRNLQAEAQRGSVEAESELAFRYLTGDGVPQDGNLGTHLCEKAAQGGDCNAQVLMGLSYQTGLTVPIDLVRAAHWYQLAAASGCTAGKLYLGLLYLNGFGVHKDIPLAKQMFEEAANDGSGAAAHYLGLIYYLGLTGTRDISVAEKWFGVAAKLHDPLGAYDLAGLFSGEADHPHDFPKAADLLRQSADAGYVRAMGGLGFLLINHPEVKQGVHEPIALLETAANAGDWRSSVLLGIFARDGERVPVDKRSAYLHLQIAVLQGEGQADHLLRHDIDTLNGSLDEAERAALVSEARTWYMQHPPHLFLVADHAQTNYFLQNISPEAIIGAFAKRNAPK